MVILLNLSMSAETHYEMLNLGSYCTSFERNYSSSYNLFITMKLLWKKEDGETQEP
jgi:hypothetical protein